MWRTSSSGKPACRRGAEGEQHAPPPLAQLHRRPPPQGCGGQAAKVELLSGSEGPAACRCGGSCCGVDEIRAWCGSEASASRFIRLSSTGDNR
jgi:hypothetical protein